MIPPDTSHPCASKATVPSRRTVFRSRRKIRAGKEYVFRQAGDSAQSINVTCIWTEQRNWSRIGLGTACSNGSLGEAPKLFLKQYVNRTGVWNEKAWSYEHTATPLAKDILDGLVYVPPLLLADESTLVNVYEYTDIVSLDVLLRRDSAGFAKAFPVVLAKMKQVLETLSQASPEATSGKRLPAKQRPYGGDARAISFKGFDIRNVGIFTPPDGNSRDLAVAMFDFGRIYLAPIEEAAAKLFISIGLLNWGRPLRRFLRGPNFDLLNRSLEPLRPYLDGEALRAELRLQQSFRPREAQGGGRMERALKRFGIDVLGRKYLRQLGRWCARHVG